MATKKQNGKAQQSNTYALVMPDTSALMGRAQMGDVARNVCDGITLADKDVREFVDAKFTLGASVNLLTDACKMYAIKDDAGAPKQVYGIALKLTAKTREELEYQLTTALLCQEDLAKAVAGPNAKETGATADKAKTIAPKVKATLSTLPSSFPKYKDGVPQYTKKGVLLTEKIVVELIITADKTVNQSTFKFGGALSEKNRIKAGMASCIARNVALAIQA